MLICAIISADSGACDFLRTNAAVARGESGQFASSAALLHWTFFDGAKIILASSIGFLLVGERERESFYIRVPSPAGLIGWNIPRLHVLNLKEK